MTDRYDHLEVLITRLGDGQFCRTLLEAMGDDLLIIDEQARIRVCGSRVAARLGYTAEDLCGSLLINLLAPDSQIAGIARIFVPRQTFQTHFKRRDGTIVVCSGRTLPLDDQQGISAGAICVFETKPHGTQLEDLDQQPRLNDAQALVLEESNHRVRNNLAMICALLDMEILQAPEGERQRLQVSLARTRSLALPHNLMEDASGKVEVGILTRAVMDSVRSLYARADATVSVTSAVSVHMTIRRSTYLALALTEIGANLLQCAANHGAQASPTIHITEPAPGEVAIAITAKCNLPQPQCAELAPLSREILVGLVERSLGGRFDHPQGQPFTATIYCPLADSATSRS